MTHRHLFCMIALVGTAALMAQSKDPESASAVTLDGLKARVAVEPAAELVNTLEELDRFLRRTGGSTDAQLIGVLARRFDEMEVPDPATVPEDQIPPPVVVKLHTLALLARLDRTTAEQRARAIVNSPWPVLRSVAEKTLQGPPDRPVRAEGLVIRHLNHDQVERVVIALLDSVDDPAVKTAVVLAVAERPQRTRESMSDTLVSALTKAYGDGKNPALGGAVVSALVNHSLSKPATTEFLKKIVADPQTPVVVKKLAASALEETGGVIRKQ